LQIIKIFEKEKGFPNSYPVLGRNPAGNRVRPGSRFPFPTPAWPILPTCPSKQSRPSQWPSLPLPSSPLGPYPRQTEAKRRLRAPYEILTKSEPNSIKVGLEIEFNLPARSPTEKPYKKVPRWPSIASNSATTLTALPAINAPLHPIFRPTEALSSTAGTRRCRWSAPHRELVTREAPRRQRTGREKPHRCQPSTSPTTSS
jgi:hypothetical protein